MTLATLSEQDLKRRIKDASMHVEIAWANTGSPTAQSSQDIFDARMAAYDAACDRLAVLKAEMKRRGGVA